MLKREVEIEGEYAWQEQYTFGRDEYRKVVLLEFLPNPGGRHVLVRDRDGEFETHLERLVKPWSELGPKAKESEFRTHDEKYEHDQLLAKERDPVGFEIEELWQGLEPFEPGKGGLPRVPERLPPRFKDMARAVLKLDMGLGIVRDEQVACYNMLRELVNICDRIRDVAGALLPAWEAEEKEAQYRSFIAERVRRRLEDGELPFASSEIMPVYAAMGCRAIAARRNTTPERGRSGLHGAGRRRLRGARPLRLARCALGLGFLPAVAGGARSRDAACGAWASAPSG